MASLQMANKYNINRRNENFNLRSAPNTFLCVRDSGLLMPTPLFVRVWVPETNYTHQICAENSSLFSQTTGGRISVTHAFLHKCQPRNIFKQFQSIEFFQRAYVVSVSPYFRQLLLLLFLLAWTTENSINSNQMHAFVNTYSSVISKVHFLTDST